MKNYPFTLLLLTAINFHVFCQVIPHHEKKIYKSADGKIFYNKSLPAYIFISTSPAEDAPVYLLHSESTPKYSNPMYFDTEGKNTLKSPSAVDTNTKATIIPKQDVQFEIYVDSKPPKTEIFFDKQKIKFNKGIYYIPDSLSVTFSAKDELSGTENIYLSVDSNEFNPVDKALVLKNEKPYILKYYSVDNTGNAENLKEIKFTVDKTPPVSKLNIVGENYNEIVSGTTQFNISASDNISGVKQIYVSIDDSIFKPYTKNINIANLPQGDHKIFFYTVDHLHNQEDTKSFSFYVDKTAPQVIEEIQGKSFIANGKEFSAGTSKLKIISFDNKAGVKEIFYSINNELFTKYEKPIDLTGYKGDVLIKSYAVDNVGNQSISDLAKSRKNAIPYIDLSAPWVSHSFKGPYYKNRDTVFINNKTNIKLEAKDTESGIQKIEYQIDNNELINYNKIFSLENEGYHSISVYGYDNTENLTRQEFGVFVDTIGPEIFECFSSKPIGIIEIDGKKINVYPDNVVLFLSATDTKAGFEALYYNLNNIPMQSYTKEIKNFIIGKLNRLVIKAVDKLGNYNEKLIEFYIM